MKRSRLLVTPSALREDLARAGVRPGMGLMVHSSLSAVGWVLGGAPSVVRALLEALGEGGTLVMPAATPQCSDPADWPEPPPAEWLETAREHMPPFDRRTTPTSLGAVPETFRTWPGSLRSDHPVESVCARGPRAAEITRRHPLAFSEGPGGPFEKRYELDFYVLLLGVGFNRCTALHYAETLTKNRRTTTVRLPYEVEGGRLWREIRNVADDNDLHFPIIGDSFVSTGEVRSANVGEAPTTLFPVRALVDFAVEYLERALAPT